MKFKKAFTLFSTLIVMIVMIGVLPAGAASYDSGSASLGYSSTGTTQIYIVLFNMNVTSANAGYDAI